MKNELRPEIVMPTRTDTTRFVAVGVGCALLGAGVTMLAVDPTSVLVVPAAPAPAPMEPASLPVALLPVGAEPIPATAPVTAPDPRAHELQLVFQAGGTSYMKLVSIATADQPGGEIMPRHGAVTLVDDDGHYTAISPVAIGDVPSAYRAWQTRTVTVDSGCTAKITGFAVASRLVGEPSYAGVTGAGPKRDEWTAPIVFEHGVQMLVARLDGCDGTFARDAALSPVVALETLDDDALASAAKRLVIDSEVARATQRLWVEAEREGLWHLQTPISAQVLKHPKTGATWVSVHAHIGYACGGPEVNVWGLFRVGPTGKLTTVELRKLGALESIEQVLDIDGDGALELIGKTWPGIDRLVVAANGDELARLDLQFFGCAC